VLDQGS